MPGAATSRCRRRRGMRGAGPSPIEQAALDRAGAARIAIRAVLKRSRRRVGGGTGAPRPRNHWGRGPRVFSTANRRSSPNLGPILEEPHALSIQHRIRRSGVPWSGALRSKSAVLALPHSQIRFLTLRGSKRPDLLSNKSNRRFQGEMWLGRPLRKGRFLSISLATAARLNFLPLRPGRRRARTIKDPATQEPHRPPQRKIAQRDAIRRDLAALEESRGLAQRPVGPPPTS